MPCHQQATATAAWRLEHLDLAGAFVLAVLHLKVHRSTHVGVLVSIKNSCQLAPQSSQLLHGLDEFLFGHKSFYTSIRRGL